MHFLSTQTIMRPISDSFRISATWTTTPAGKNKLNWAHHIIQFKGWTCFWHSRSYLMWKISYQSWKNTQPVCLHSVSPHRKSMSQLIQCNGTPTDISTSRADLVAHGLWQPAKWSVSSTVSSILLLLEHTAWYLKQIQLCILCCTGPWHMTDGCSGLRLSKHKTDHGERIWALTATVLRCDKNVWNRC